MAVSKIKIVEPIEIKIKCPVCQKDIYIRLTERDFENSPSGIIRVPVEHSDPYPHILIVDVDSTGFVRGAYLYKKIMKKTMYQVSQIIDKLGEERAVMILFNLLLHDKITFEGREELVKEAKELVEMLEETNKLGNQGKKINIDKTTPPKAAIYVLRQIIRLSKRLPTDSAKYEWIKGEYSRLKRGLEAVRSLLVQKRKWTSAELIKNVDVNLSKDDLRLIIDILDLKGLDASRKLKDKEYKVKGLII